MIFSFIGCMLCLCIMAASVGGVLLSMYIVQVTADDAETLDLDNQKNRQTSIAAVQNAVGEWSACVNSAFRIGDAQQPFGDVFQAWTQQFLTAVGVAAPTDAGSGKKASGGAA